MIFLSKKDLLDDAKRSFNSLLVLSHSLCERFLILVGYEIGFSNIFIKEEK